MIYELDVSTKEKVEFLPCKMCGSNEIEVVNCGYSSFNCGYVKCKTCGHEAKSNLAYWNNFKCIPILAKLWNDINYIPSLKEQIEKAKEKLKLSQTEYNSLMAQCTHSFVKRTISDGAYCEICGKDGGWFCPDSEDHVCHYNFGSEFCRYCGKPEERL